MFQQDILKLAFEVHRITEEKINVIETLTRRTKTLSLNARIEASRAGQQGAAFEVVAQEMSQFANEVGQLSTELRGAIASNISRIENAGEAMMLDFRGSRFADLSRNVVEIIDRNLYERSCDVRWWATDSAIVNAATRGSEDPNLLRQASARLATILRSYTVYLDLWVADRNGKIICNGRGDRYHSVIGQDVSKEEWFRKAMRTATGDDFAVCDIARNSALHNSAVATYSTAIRGDGETFGEPIGALGIFFDWEPQAQDIVKNVALTDDEKRTCRVMLLNADFQIIAASDDHGFLTDKFPLNLINSERAYYRAGENMVSYALTPGYETYAGLGWYGCIQSAVPTY